MTSAQFSAASDFPDLQWRKWVALHFIIPGILLLTAGGIAAVCGTESFSGISAALLKPGMLLSGTAGFLSSAVILTGFCLLAAVSIFGCSGKPAAWAALLASLWLAVCVPGPGLAPLFENGFSPFVWVFVTDAVLLLIAVRLCLKLRSVLPAVLALHITLIFGSYRLAPLLLGLLMLVAARIGLASSAKKGCGSEIPFRLLVLPGYALAILAAVSWYAWIPETGLRPERSFMIQGALLLSAGLLIVLAGFREKHRKQH